MRTIRIARVILNLGVPAAFMQEDRWKGNKWDAHKGALRKTYEADPDAYRTRLRRIAEEARVNNCEGVIYPACAFVLDSRSMLKAYLRETSVVRWVFAGTYALDAPEKAAEGAVVSLKGAQVLSFDAKDVHELGLGDVTAMAAISSTIGQVGKGRVVPCETCPPDFSLPTLLVDMGHHQYSGRYTGRLKAAVRAAQRRNGRPAIAILSYWKYKNTRPHSWWAFEKDRAIEGRRRPPLTGPQGEQDLLDIFTIHLRQTRRG